MYTGVCSDVMYVTFMLYYVCNMPSTIITGI